MFPKAGKLALVLALVISLAPGRAQAWITRDDFVPCVRSGTSAADSETRLHRVARGETLWGIARNLGIDVEVLMAMNGLDDNSLLLEGQLIKIPYRQSRLHRVKTGETVWKIARMYQADVNEILNANRITRPERLRAGTVLLIPGSKPYPVVAPTSRGFLTSALSWPLVGTITSKFGGRKSGFHHGVDIAAKKGTPIRAADAGEVIFAGWKPVYGQTVIIKHPGNKTTLYGHASKIKVKKGQKVRRGQVIAEVGSSGVSTGPHLHFEVRVDDEVKNPLLFLSR
ncbi:MAG TPA: M23 family metallopeptidase [Syntrophothermus lipocalidus]|uniref:Peptidase M23 n=1 Tax=Syntrophothermus lipocalidus (strain DSM 12680 / TGB-C1) TaxID=643648 RepID=D7CK61_SYNLT|nr:M23 family metallopeptidase [Syntrophothermus lipocalidus]ADI03045.1 Peptidase M23 [Syntrophothermus lipocalidus DSM 12680]HHV76262.1 M23 family metallopeptidase [Syntrophothermus lipocalidus]